MLRREWLASVGALACGGLDRDATPGAEEELDDVFSRRPDARQNRGRVGAPLLAVPKTFELVTSVTPVLSIHAADLVVLDDDTLGVTAWQDRTGNGRHYANLGADSTLPLWSASDGPNGKPCVSGDGSARFIANVNWDPPAPGTTAMYWRAIVRLNTWTDGAHIWGGATASRLALRCITSTPNVRILNTTPGVATAMTLGTWFRVEALYSNSTSDFLKVGSTSNTGTNVGNNDQAAHALFGLTTGTGLAHCDIAKLEIFTGGAPTSGERTAMDNSDASYYGGGITF